MLSLISANNFREREISTEEQLWLGVEYPDGRTATNVQHSWSGADEGEIVSLSSRGGRGHTRAYDTEYWLAPLPPAGSLTFVCAWPLFNIPETRTAVDDAPILEAVSRTEILWPDEPDATPQEQPAPPTPPGGWFTDATRRT